MCCLAHLKSCKQTIIVYGQQIGQIVCPVLAFSIDGTCTHIVTPKGQAQYEKSRYTWVSTWIYHSFFIRDMAVRASTRFLIQGTVVRLSTWGWVWDPRYPFAWEPQGRDSTLEPPSLPNEVRLGIRCTAPLCCNPCWVPPRTPAPTPRARCNTMFSSA